MPKRKILPIEARIEANIDYCEVTGCWLWIGSHDTHGYGQIHIKGKQCGAHRIIYERHKGPIPDGLEIDHLCGNKACVNPDHLEIVTHKINVRRAYGWADDAQYKRKKKQKRLPLVERLLRSFDPSKARDST
jgi:hypothetical protein